MDYDMTEDDKSFIDTMLKWCFGMVVWMKIPSTYSHIWMIALLVSELFGIH